MCKRDKPENSFWPLVPFGISMLSTSGQILLRRIAQQCGTHIVLDSTGVKENDPPI